MVLSRCGIGLALYQYSSPWAKWGDSMKIREYLSVGLPVITTNVPSTADDVEEAGVGFVIRDVKKELTKTIEEVFQNISLWNTMRHKAIQFSLDHSVVKILDERLKMRL